MGKSHRRGSVTQPDLSVLGPIRELIRQVEQGKRTKEQIQAFNEGRNPFEVWNPLDIDNVIAILGAEKVVTVQQACESFIQLVPAGEVSVRYSEKTLWDCALLNKMGQADWRLVYGLPLSLRKQRDIIGTERNSQLRFYDNDWWLGDKEDAWAKSLPEKGYYLIDIKGRFNRTNWNDQSVRISELGEQYERADERIFAQALISILKTHGERLHTGTYHWGRIEDTDGYRVCVGHFDSLGLGIGAGRPSEADEFRVVCISRKWDF